MASDKVVKELRRPFHPESVGFKVQTNPKEKQGGGFTQGVVVAFIDARAAVARLNAVCPGDWEDNYVTPPAPLADGLVCRLTVQGATRQDIGFSQNLTTDMGVKALYSDAFKRAAVKFEVGSFLYSLPRMYVKADELTKRGQGDRAKWYMPDRTLASLRAQYGQWLEREGSKYFGDPLSVGDSADAQGDVEVPSDRTSDEPLAAHPDLQSVPKAGENDPLGFVWVALKAKKVKGLPDQDEWVKNARAASDPDSLAFAALEAAGYENPTKVIAAAYEKAGVKS